jgi:hypothetical protein
MRDCLYHLPAYEKKEPGITTTFDNITGISLAQIVPDSPMGHEIIGCLLIHDPWNFQEFLYIAQQACQHCLNLYRIG